MITENQESEIPINDPPSPLGNSTEAIVNTELSSAGQKEKTIELLSNMMHAVAGGNDMSPIIIGIKNGKPTVIECKVDECGNIIIPEMKANSKSDIEQKSKFVRRIMREITPVLQAQIEGVTFIALMRKDKGKLSGMMKALKKKNAKIRIENRLGCIWLVIDEFEFVI